jgi:uncharacterized protein (TIGR03437 family)
MNTFFSLVAMLCAFSAVPVFAQTFLNTTASRVVGHPSLPYAQDTSAPNLIEGREFSQPWNVVVDTTSSPPALYVADTGNNRVLFWRNAKTFGNGSSADGVVGQIDFTDTQAQGPVPGGRSTGLSAPGAMAIDRDGNLYVVDTGNNRILRFPKPVAPGTPAPYIPDLVIGQVNFSGRASNQGGPVSASSVSLASGSTAGRSGLAFDAQGNLWFSDPLNHRVLRYPASALQAGNLGPAADLVLGQPDLTSAVVPGNDAETSLNRTVLRSPSGLAFDSTGRLYVADELGRVLVFAPPFTTRESADRILGRVVLEQGQQVPLDTVLFTPEGVFSLGDRIGVVDFQVSRILIYPPASQWPAETETRPSPSFQAVLGQDSFSGVNPNRGLPMPTERTLAFPVGAFFADGEVYVADTVNNRVLVFPQAATGAAAVRVLGQPSFNLNGQNLVEGRGMFLYAGTGTTNNLGGAFSDGSGVAVDTRSSPPRLYVADTFNNRVLGYADARKVRPGDPADIVVGQIDFSGNLPNMPGGRRDVVSDRGLNRPAGVAVDASGNLWVADAGNGRVLRFSDPFGSRPPAGDYYRPNLVIGQPNAFVEIPDAGSRSLANPHSLAFTVDGHLVVSDSLHNRVLFFRRPEGGDFQTFQEAEKVVGQPDFFSTAAGSANNRLNSPKHISLDTDDRLYVADTGNNRVQVFDRITTAPNNPSSAFTLTSGIRNPQGLYVSPRTGEIWVGDTGGNRALRFPRFERLAVSTASDYTIPSPAPLAMTQDSLGNLYVAEGNNRIAIFYNLFRTPQIAGSFAYRPLAPGTVASVFPISGQNLEFTDQTVPAPALPLTKELADTEVLLNGEPVLLYLVSPRQINFVVPMNAPTSGSGELQVIRKSTGQVIATRTVQFASAAPALFTTSGFGEGQVAAVNQDGTINSPSNPVARGQYVTLYGTGQGFVPGAPADGSAPSQPLRTETLPRVFVGGGGDFVSDDHIIFSGLSTEYPGLWQVSVRIPDTVIPDSARQVVVQMLSVPSNVVGTEQDGVNRPFIVTTIAVRQ